MKRVLATLLLCMLLTGCWDQLELKNSMFVDTIGIDYAGESKKLKVNFVIASLREASQGGGKPSGQYMESTGTNLFEVVAETSKKMPGIITALETRLYLLSTRFAKDRPLDYLNSTSQFVSNPMYAYLALYDGDISELLAKKQIKEQTVSQYLFGILEDEHDRGRIQANKLLHYILGGTEFINDFAINRFEPLEDGVRLAGIALFRDGKYTEVNLNNEEAQLAYMMEGADGHLQLLTGNANGKPYTVLVQHIKRNFQFDYKDQGINEIKAVLKLDVKLIEEGLGSKAHTDPIIAELEKSITADISLKLGHVLSAIQKANCDYFQLGHEVAAFHPAVYKAMNWREQYPSIRIQPEVNVRIVNKGILE